MATQILMPALSPTMEEGTLAKWLVKEGDAVKSGDIMAEIETDKATMEFEAVDEGIIGKLLVAEGTASVKVHDVANIPDDGLHYWVGVPAGLGPHRRDCERPKIARVRAVLSWSSLPSTTDPDLVPHWGNRLDTHVEVKPGTPVTLDAAIDIVGGISVSQIDVVSNGRTVPGAVFAEGGTPADQFGPSRTCPFGGRVNVQADVPAAFAAAGIKYRLVTRKSGTLAEIPV